MNFHLTRRVRKGLGRLQSLFGPPKTRALSKEDREHLVAFVSDMPGFPIYIRDQVKALVDQYEAREATHAGQLRVLRDLVTVDDAHNQFEPVLPLTCPQGDFRRILGRFIADSDFARG